MICVAAVTWIPLDRYRRSSCSRPPELTGRGTEANPMLQRIYGTAWESRDKMRVYLKQREQAQQRDHRRLGTQMGLFFFDQVAPANPFFRPKGAFVYNTLVDYVRGLYQRYGYDEVITPQMFKTDLFKTSGHYDNYIEQHVHALRSTSRSMA